MLVGKSGIAKTSSTPGKTQLINHFLINEKWFLADLPGYGYARVSKRTREQWTSRMREYLIKRVNLSCVFMLIDGSIAFQNSDHQMISWMGEKGIPFVIVITKFDKANQRLIKKNVELIKEILQQEWETLPAFYITSCKTKKGKPELLSFISSVIES